MKRILDVCSRSFFRKLLLCIAVVFVLFTFFGFFVLPGVLLSKIQNGASGALHRETSIQELKVNPFTLSVTVKGLTITERNDPGKWIAAEEIFADFQLMSLFRMGPVLREIRVVSPYVNIVRNADGAYNFSDLLEEFAPKEGQKSGGLRFSLNNIQVIDGQVDFTDNVNNANHKVEKIQIAIPFISNSSYAANRYVQPSFSAVVNGDLVSMEGKTKLFHDSLETSFDIDITGLTLPKYLEYVPFRMEYEAPSALLDVKAVISFVQHNTGRPTIRIDGHVELRDVRIIGKDKSPMIFLPSVQADVSSMDIGGDEYRLASLAVREPEIDAVINEKKILNLMALIPENIKENSSAEKDAPVAASETSPGVIFSVDSFTLSGGKVRFTDISGRAPFKTVLSDIYVDVNDFSTASGKSSKAEVSVSTEAGETANVKAQFSVSPAVSAGTFSVGKLALSKYTPYYMDLAMFKAMRGTADIESGYEISQSPEGFQFSLNGLTLSVDSLRLRQNEEKEDFLDVPSFIVRDARIDSLTRELVVGEISTEKGRVWVRRMAGGEINALRLVPQIRDNAASPKDEKPWTATLNKASVSGYGVRFDDAAMSPPIEFAFDGVRFDAEGLSTVEKSQGKFSFAATFNRAGVISLSGASSLNPPTVSAMLNARNLSIGAAYPYFMEDVKIIITGGDASAEGMVRISVPRDAPIAAGYKGKASISNFASVDKEQGDPFLSFKALLLNGVDVSYPPANVLLEDITLSDFYSRIILHEDASLNLQGVVGTGGAKDNTAQTETTETASSDPSPTSAGKATVRINKLTFLDGRVDFSDRYIKPNYSANLVGLKGSIYGISSEENKRADVDLEGSLGHGAPLGIKGAINPLSDDLFLDLNVGFNGIDLSPLTPYSSRYAGYEIEKGKLTLNLSYHIENRKLEAQNKLFLDQFTFGDPVDSPDATNLPVKLAVSLLKDRNGEIHMELPVSGDLDNPQFSFWGILWQAVRNLLLKAASAPFSLIGSLLGGSGEQLSYLEFEPGSSEITQAGEEKITNISKILADRPALKLEIIGRADPDADMEALRHTILRRKVAAFKVKAQAAAGLPSPAPDNVIYQQGEYEKYLKMAYTEEKFSKPRNLVGMEKDLPAPEMENLMLSNIRATEDDLRQLALERAERVRDALVLGGEVEPERVFLVEPKAVSPQKKEDVKDSRVDFAIR